MLEEIKKFDSDVKNRINSNKNNKILNDLSKQWVIEAARCKYVYNFNWLGIPIIQLPQDIMAMQEIIWKVKPDLIIETGIAHGGSLIFYASMMQLLNNDGTVIGIDIDIRKHNKINIENHPLYKNITMIEGSSTDEKIVKKVYRIASSKKSILIALDSNHTHEHVLKELTAYSPLITKNSYIVVFDTIIEDLPSGLFPDRPWSKVNNPKTAIQMFLKKNDRFEINKEIDNKLCITECTSGFLKCLKN